MSVYKKFRSSKDIESGILSSRYDQPTYISFKLEFAQNNDLFYNDAGKTMYRTLNYDTMPHPLFGEQGAADINSRESYSSIDYLIDSNEYTRAKMLKEFISKFNELQRNFQWYFKSIEGLDDLLKIKLTSGQRVLSDKRLTINMLEGIDLRVSHLLNLYRKVAWDDTYQRWVLPEMMRYFTLNIYISEFRTFHTASIDQENIENQEMVLSILDNVLPTWIIKCEMCEFDIESFNFDYLKTLDISEAPNEAATSFSIKVGKIYETQTYPIFKNAYLIDKYINGSNRLIEKQSYNTDGYLKNYDHTSPDEENNYVKNEFNIAVAQNTIYDSSEESYHKSSLPFNENANDTTLLKSADVNKNTWISNALKSGTALALNYAEQQIDKLKMTPMPKLGVSINEFGTALQSKDIFSVLGMIRKAVTTVANDQVEPSEKLRDSIIDSSFRAVLEGLASSQSTSKDSIPLVHAANMALNDKGIWDTIRDYSRATNLSGPNEVNILSKIENQDIYKNIVGISTSNDRSKATDLDGGVSSIKSDIISTQIRSAATNNKLIL